MYVIAGLGNPGAKYDNTRHNAGFMSVDYLAKEYNISVTKLKHKVLIGEGNIQGEKVIIVKPQTFMNNSGEAIREIVDFYKIDVAKELVVVYDDMDTDVGKLRIRAKGSAGTHNGMKSIIYHLGRDDFARIRVGIGKPPHPDFETVDFVLGRFLKSEEKDVFDAIERSSDAVATLIKAGVDMAMNRFNG